MPGVIVRVSVIMIVMMVSHSGSDA
jgi:hypothetical protein